jgi:hypothetical protein
LATRTWVSGVGDDVNPGSRTAPCKTFAGAFSKTDPGGEINVIDPGGFGAITINKSITIDGQGAFASILPAAGATGVLINAGANDVVTLRNLSINGAGTGFHGIRFLAGAALNIENCVIFGFLQKGVSIEDAAAPCRVFIKDTIIRNNGGGGVLFQPGANGVVNAALHNVSLVGNLFGVTVADRVSASISNCLITGNTNAGIAVKGPSAFAFVQIDDCIVSQNNASAGTVGVSATGASAVVVLSSNTVYQNSIGLSATGGAVLATYGNNRLFNNTSNGATNATSVLQ